jgi:hypothetical protein
MLSNWEKSLDGGWSGLPAIMTAGRHCGRRTASRALILSKPHCPHQAVHGFEYLSQFRVEIDTCHVCRVSQHDEI